VRGLDKIRRRWKKKSLPLCFVFNDRREFPTVFTMRFDHKTGRPVGRHPEKLVRSETGLQRRYVFTLTRIGFPRVVLSRLLWARNRGAGAVNPDEFYRAQVTRPLAALRCAAPATWAVKPSKLIYHTKPNEVSLWKNV